MRPNIVYLNSHDTGRYIQPYGHPVPTPNLQRFAEEGVLFRQTFCGNPTCSPSRACLLTGQWAHCNGMLGLAHRGFTLNDYSRHLAAFLRSAGYTTALAGGQHEVSPKFAPLSSLGYEHLLNYDGEWADQSKTIPSALKFLEKASQPFFLALGLTETHRPYPHPAPQYDWRYTLPPAPLPDTPETRRDMAAFKTLARTMDEKFGAVLAALQANGLAENTLVIVTTDHGIAFPSMKCNLTDHGIGVMLLMRGPGGLAGGKALDGLVSQIDVFPTICEVAGIAPPSWLQGKSLMPLVNGSADEVNDAIYAEVNYHASYEPMRCVRTRRWKYIRRFDDVPAPTRTLKADGQTCGWKLPAGPVLPNTDDSASKSVWLKHGWKDRVRAGEELYDVIFDPHETNNLIMKPQMDTDEHRWGSAAAGALAEMRQRLDEWMRRTDDPLLRGPLPIPKGAHVNDPCAGSPNERVFTVE